METKCSLPQITHLSPPNVMEVWKNDTTVIHCPSMLKCGKENRIQTFLKAFEYAPRWTDQELLIFKNVFAEYGMMQHGRKTFKMDVKFS